MEQSKEQQDQLRRRLAEVLEEMEASNEEANKLGTELLGAMLGAMAATWIEDAGNVYLLAIERFLRHEGQTPLEIMDKSATGRAMVLKLDSAWRGRLAEVKLVVSTPEVKEFLTTVQALIRKKLHNEAADYIIRAVRARSIDDRGTAFDYVVAVYPNREKELGLLFFSELSFGAVDTGRVA